MIPVLLAGATWLHLLATVSVIGLYVVMAWSVTPIALADPAYGGAVAAAYRRAKPLVLIGWLVFILTGVTMMLLNDQYAGVGQFANGWSILMLVKHVVVLAMVLMSGFTNACPVIGVTHPLESALRNYDPERTRSVLKSLHTRESITALLGVVILLLTAAAEIS